LTMLPSLKSRYDFASSSCIWGIKVTFLLAARGRPPARAAALIAVLPAERGATLDMFQGRVNSPTRRDGGAVSAASRYVARVIFGAMTGAPTPVPVKSQAPRYPNRSLSRERLEFCVWASVWLGSAGCQPVVFGSLPKTLCAPLRTDLRYRLPSHALEVHPASCRMRQAGSLRSPERTSVAGVLRGAEDEIPGVYASGCEP